MTIGISKRKSSIFAIGICFVIAMVPAFLWYKEKQSKDSPLVCSPCSTDKEHEYLPTGPRRFYQIGAPNPHINIVRFTGIGAAEEDSIECVPLKQPQSVPTQICIHEPKKDIFVSKRIINTGSFEGNLHKDLLTLLNMGHEYGLIDIGANIGTHSLDVAKMGRAVVAVEPMNTNLVRLKKSVRLNNIQKNYILLNNAISHKRTCVDMANYQQGTNQGTFAMANDSIVCNKASVHTITIYDLLDVIPFENAVMKIDVEGSEPEIFENAAYFFSKVNVPAVFMEFQLFQMNKRRATKANVDAMVTFFYHEKFRPYTIGTSCPLNQPWVRWPHTIIWLRNDTIPWFLRKTRRKCNSKIRYVSSMIHGPIFD